MRDWGGSFLSMQRRRHEINPKKWAMLLILRLGQLVGNGHLMGQDHWIQMGLGQGKKFTPSLLQDQSRLGQNSRSA